MWQGSNSGALREVSISGMLESACLERGWSLLDLAREAGVSRTTLHSLMRGHVRRPQSATLRGLSDALGIPVAQFARTLRRGRTAATANLPFEFFDVERQREFDRQTNPAVDDVVREQPGLFFGWSEEDWDELYANFGAGGPLTESGVVECAERMNRQRETLQRLRVVLNTHLAEAAAGIVDALYASVTEPQEQNKTRRRAGEE